MKNSQRLDANNNPTPVASFIDAETIDGSSASAQSTLTGEDDGLLVRIKVVSTDNVWIKIDEDPTASAGDNCTLLSGGETEYVMLQPLTKIAVYGGEINITKCY